MKSDSFTLSAGTARADIHPERGGAIGHFEALVGDKWVEIFQLKPSGSRKDVFELGCNVLVPFSNRLSGGGFWYDDVFHKVEPNLRHNPHPIHGNGFLRRWDVKERDSNFASLKLISQGPGPFKYEAALEYWLSDASLTMELRVTNSGQTPLPFGIGFHPWFVRTPLSRLTMTTKGHWSHHADQFPDKFIPSGSDSDFEFSLGRQLPPVWMNNAFVGWNGNARLDWPEWELAVTIQAQPPLNTLMVYSPPSADFVCLEPVSHSVDAHNRRGPNVAAPQVLGPNDVICGQLTISLQQT